MEPLPVNKSLIVKLTNERLAMIERLEEERKLDIQKRKNIEDQIKLVTRNFQARILQKDKDIQKLEQKITELAEIKKLKEQLMRMNVMREKDRMQITNLQKENEVLQTELARKCAKVEARKWFLENKYGVQLD